MTNYSFKVFDKQGNIVYTGCEGSLALRFQMMGHTVKQFYNEVEL